MNAALTLLEASGEQMRREGERIEGWATRYRQNDAIYFKSGDVPPNSEAGIVCPATLIIGTPTKGDGE